MFEISERTQSDGVRATLKNDASIFFQDPFLGSQGVLQKKFSAIKSYKQKNDLRLFQNKDL